LSVPDEGYSSLLILSVPDEDYSNLFTLTLHDESYYILLTLSEPGEVYSNLLTLSVPDEGYSRNVSSTRNYISTFYLTIMTSLSDKDCFTSTTYTVDQSCGVFYILPEE
jgi:hypothetical protein